MIHKQSDSGVSPVVGVILMVAITVIIAAVVANFVLDLGQQLGEDADATLNFDQSVHDFGDNKYEVEVTVSDMQNSDYLVISSVGGAGDFPTTGTEGDNLAYSGVEPDDRDNIPGESADSQSVDDSDSGVVVLSSGDQATITELEGEDTLQVFGGIDGEESLVQEYDVEDTLG